jgi:hypothetical protein
MFQPTAFKLILVAVLAGSFYLVLGNSHIDIFPCEVTSRDYEKKEDVKTSEVCSLLDVNRPATLGDQSDLTGAGWAVAVLVIGVVPFFLGFGLGHKLEKKKQDA